MGIFGFFGEIWQSYLNDLSLIGQVLAVTPFLGYLFVVPLAAWRYFRGARKNLAVELAEEKQASQRWLGKYNMATEEIDFLERQIPENWLKFVKSERKEGNEERAIGRLRDEFRTAGRPLAEAASILAEYHSSVAFDLGEEHLIEARRYCRLALLHGGANTSQQSLLDEIELHLPKGNSNPEVHYEDWDDLHAAYSTVDDGLIIVQNLNNATRKSKDLGHYKISSLINRRALLIASRASLGNHPDVLATRYLKAQVLDSLGQHQGTPTVSAAL